MRSRKPGKNDRRAWGVWGAKRGELWLLVREKEEWKEGARRAQRERDIFGPPEPSVRGEGKKIGGEGKRRAVILFQLRKRAGTADLFVRHPSRKTCLGGGGRKEGDRVDSFLYEFQALSLADRSPTSEGRHCVVMTSGEEFSGLGNLLRGGREVSMSFGKQGGGGKGK